MAEVFADTSGWAAFFVRTEPAHTDAAALLGRWQTRGTTVVTTNYVLAELVALLVSRVRATHARRLAITGAIRAASWVDVVHVDPTLDTNAWALLASRPDKDWSLVDCASFVVMARRGITDALTPDHHFEQAGYSRLLR